MINYYSSQAVTVRMRVSLTAVVSGSVSHLAVYTIFVRLVSWVELDKSCPNDIFCWDGALTRTVVVLF